MSGALLVGHAAVTWAMTGVIWIVQVVVYPLFPRAAGDAFPAYARAHAARIIPLLAPVMAAEMAAAAWIAARPPAGVPPGQALAGLLLLLGIWALTGAVLLPRHARLRRAYDAATARALVRWNWARTVLWSARALLAAAWLLQDAGR